MAECFSLCMPRIMPSNYLCCKIVFLQRLSRLLSHCLDAQERGPCPNISAWQIESVFNVLCKENLRRLYKQNGSNFLISSFLILIHPSVSADVSEVKSEAWENLKGKNIDFYHSIRHVIQYIKYIWPKYMFFPPPPKKRGFKECYFLCYQKELNWTRC